MGAETHGARTNAWHPAAAALATRPSALRSRRPCSNRRRRSPGAIKKATRRQLPPRPAAPACLGEGNKLKPRGQRRSPCSCSSSGGHTVPRRAAPPGWTRGAPGDSTLRRGRARAAARRPRRNKSPVTGLHPAEPGASPAERARRLTPPRAAAGSPSLPPQRCPRSSSGPRRLGAPVENGRCRHPPDRRQQSPRRLNAIAGTESGGGRGTDTAPRTPPAAARGRRAAAPRCSRAPARRPPLRRGAAAAPPPRDAPGTAAAARRCAARSHRRRVTGASPPRRAAVVRSAGWGAAEAASRAPAAVRPRAVTAGERRRPGPATATPPPRPSDEPAGAEPH